jgi:hypothetical protein
MICDRRYQRRENDFIVKNDHVSRERRRRKENKKMWKATPVTVNPPLEDVCLHTYERKRKIFFTKRKENHGKKKYDNEKKKTHIKLRKKAKKGKLTCSNEKNTGKERKKPLSEI